MVTNAWEHLTTIYIYSLLTAATAMEVSTGDTMASVRLRPSPTSDMEVMEDTVLVAMEDTVVTVMAMASKIIFCRRNHSIMHKNVAFLMYLQIYIKMQFCVINIATQCNLHGIL